MITHPPEAPAPSPDQRASQEHLTWRWLEHSGASFPKLRLGQLEGGERGVFTQADIAPGEQVLRVPRRFMITPELARASPIGRLIEEHAPTTSEESRLAAFLLQQRESEDSFWRPYLHQLPATFPHMPLFFGEEELSLLQGSFLVEEIARWREHFLGEYALLLARVPGFSRFTADAFLWAQFTLISRTFGLKWDGKLSRCFVPLGDMFNHRQRPEAEWGLSEDGEDFVVVAREPLPANTEIHISYGLKPNFRFLLNYGFVPEDNPEDELVLYLGIPEEAPHVEAKRELLGLSPPSARRRFEVPLHYEHASTAAMFSFLRVACADEAELAHITADAQARGGLGLVDPLGPELERRVLQTLADLCEARLAGFETTLEEDERLLQEAELSRNGRNCVLLRRGEKRLLQAYAGLARTFIPMLSGTSSDHENRSAS